MTCLDTLALWELREGLPRRRPRLRSSPPEACAAAGALSQAALGALLLRGICLEPLLILRAEIPDRLLIARRSFCGLCLLRNSERQHDPSRRGLIVTPKSSARGTTRDEVVKDIQ